MNRLVFCPTNCSQSAGRCCGKPMYTVAPDSRLRLISRTQPRTLFWEIQTEYFTIFSASCINGSPLAFHENRRLVAEVHYAGRPDGTDNAGVDIRLPRIVKPNLRYR